VSACCTQHHPAQHASRSDRRCGPDRHRRLAVVGELSAEVVQSP
jgi:hypothetical protein